MIKTIVLATHNPHKVEEFQKAIDIKKYKIVSADEIGIKEEPIETGKTFAENALIKARFVASKTSLPVIADDSGLEIHALGNFPGIHSSRFMEGHSYQEKCHELIKRLSSFSDKSAHFTSCIAYLDEKRNELVFEGKCEGMIIDQMVGNQGFGYDPIFYVPSYQKTFAELSTEEKSAISHRGKSIQKWLQFLLSQE